MQDQASEAMEVFNELMESAVSTVVPLASVMDLLFLAVGADFLTASSPTFCS